MSFSDYFRSMFGFPRSHRPPEEPRGFNGEQQEDGRDQFDSFFGPPGGGAPRGGSFTWTFPGGEGFFFGNVPRAPQSEVPEDGEEGDTGPHGGMGSPPPFGHFGGGAGSDTADLFRHFDEMFRSFDAVFRSMGMADFPAVSPGSIPSLEAPPSGESGNQPSPSSPRDAMLKEPDSGRHSNGPDSHHPSGYHGNGDPEQGQGPQPGRSSSDRQEPADQPLQPPRASPFDWFFSPPQQPSSPKMPQDLLDSDLDDEVRRGDLLQILRPEKSTPRFPGVPEKSTPLFPGVRIMEPRPKAQPEGHYKSVRVYTYRNADGKTEERRTVEDGTGRRETTVTRSLGDQSHAVTTRRPAGAGIGDEEILQHYHNMDENDKREFDERWRDPPHLRGRQDNGPGRVFDLFRKGFSGFPSPKS